MTEEEVKEMSSAVTDLNHNWGDRWVSSMQVQTELPQQLLNGLL